jgi:hypothetical protein
MPWGAMERPGLVAPTASVEEIDPLLSFLRPTVPNDSNAAIPADRG